MMSSSSLVGWACENRPIHPHERGSLLPSGDAPAARLHLGTEQGSYEGLAPDVAPEVVLLRL